MNEKELIKRLVACLIIILACYFAFAYISTRTNIQNHGNGTNAARDEFKTIRDAQREETSVIDETKQSINRGETAVTNSQERIESSKQTNREIASVERADAEIIAECQQILKRVRERTTTEN